MDSTSKEDPAQSTPVNPEAAPAQVSDVAAAPAQVLLESLRCPKCDAELRKVTIAIGGKVNCLQCGARFSPTVTTLENGAVAVDSGGAATEKALPNREPKSPGYWLLRIPGILGLIAGVVSTVVMAIALLHESRNVSFILALQYSYAPLALAGGWLAVACTRSLARIDTSLMHRAWKARLVSEPLPAPHGSSLPFIAPLGLVGGLMPVVALMLDPDNSSGVFATALFGAVVFYFGFASEDVRQFCWRQEKLASKFSHYTWRGATAQRLVSTAFTAACGALGLVFAWFLLDAMGSRYGYRRDEIFRGALGLGICIAVGWTTRVLLRMWENAVENWALTASSSKKPGGFSTAVTTRSNSTWIVWMRRIPLIWATYGAVWMMYLFATKGGPLRRETIPVGLILLSTLALSIGLSAMISTLARWSAAIDWVFDADQKTAPKPDLSAWLVRCTIVYSLCQALALSCYFFQDMTRFGFDWQEVTAIPLLIGMIQYPILWIATIIGEFLNVERQLSTTAQDVEFWCG